MVKIIKTVAVIFLGAMLIGCATREVEPEPREEEIAREIRARMEEFELEEAVIREEIIAEVAQIDYVEAEEVGDNVILTIDERILFDTHKAEIKQTAEPILTKITKLLLDYPERMVIVAGHTDTMPVHTRKFPSNWDLSAQRAVNTVKYITYLDRLDNSRLIAAGFGEHHPVVPNDTPKNRRLNRRVEFILLPPQLEQKEIKLQLNR